MSVGDLFKSTLVRHKEREHSPPDVCKVVTEVGGDGALLCSPVPKTYSNLHTFPREHSAVTGWDKQDSPKLDAVHHVTTVPAFQKQYSLYWIL